MLKQQVFLLNNQLVQEQKVNREMLLKQFTSLRYILWQGLALQGHEEKMEISCSFYTYDQRSVPV